VTSTRGPVALPRWLARVRSWEPGRATILLGGAIAVWWLISPIYDRLLAEAANVVLRTIDLGEGTFVRQAEGNWIAYSRRLSRLETSFPALSIHEVHAPVVMLPLLLWWLPRRLGWAPAATWRVGVALVGLTVVYAFAAAAWAQQIVGLSYGAAGARLFSEAARNVWAGVTIAYRVGGRFLVVLLAWLWIFRDEIGGATDVPTRRP
jgi:hypothetical protein